MDIFYAVICFACGWGWGQWWNERKIRAEQGELVKGRMTVSMPVKQEDAAATMRLLAVLIEEAESQREAALGIPLKSFPQKLTNGESGG